MVGGATVLPVHLFLGPGFVAYVRGTGMVSILCEDHAKEGDRAQLSLMRVPGMFDCTLTPSL